MTVCTGDYSIASWSVPDAYNCDVAGSFEVSLEASIDTCYKGRTFLWIELEDESGITYRSNSISFTAEFAANMDITFGGSIPSGTYWVDARMIDVQEACPDSICVDIRKPLQQIIVTRCSPPDKTMIIEYAYQYNTLNQESYDLFQSTTLAQHMDIAYNAAHTMYNIYPGQAGIEAELIIHYTTPFRQYIRAHKETMHMFLCGVEGFCDNMGNYVPRILGMADMDTITYIPNEESGSMVAVRACEDAADTLIGCELFEFIDHVTIHELGHQRGMYDHCNSWSPYCIMKPGHYTFTGTSTIFRLWNPHFCPDCLAILHAITWKGGR